MKMVPRSRKRRIFDWICILVVLGGGVLFLLKTEDRAIQAEDRNPPLKERLQHARYRDVVRMRTDNRLYVVYDANAYTVRIVPCFACAMQEWNINALLKVSDKDLDVIPYGDDRWEGVLDQWLTQPEHTAM